MDLVDRIETTRFLGGEFVLWLWFSRDITEGEIHIPNLGNIDVSFQAQLMLADPLADQERVTIRGVDPFGSPEADQALRRGKLPRKLGLRLIFEQSEWALTLDTATLGLSSVKLPALLSQGEEEYFFERMRLFEQLHDLLQSLYGHFLLVRLSPVWEAELAPAMARWVSGELDMDQKTYDGLHRRAAKRPKRK
jgi:recombination associated protein RdgC